MFRVHTVSKIQNVGNYSFLVFFFSFPVNKLQDKKGEIHRLKDFKICVNKMWYVWVFFVYWFEQTVKKTLFSLPHENWGHCLNNLIIKEL